MPSEAELLHWAYWLYEVFFIINSHSILKMKSLKHVLWSGNTHQQWRWVGSFLTRVSQYWWHNTPLRYAYLLSNNKIYSYWNDIKHTDITSIILTHIVQLSDTNFQKNWYVKDNRFCPFFKFFSYEMLVQIFLTAYTRWDSFNVSYSLLLLVFNITK